MRYSSIIIWIISSSLCNVSWGQFGLSSRDERNIFEIKQDINSKDLVNESSFIGKSLFTSIIANQPDLNGEFIISIQTSTDVVSLQLDGEDQGLRVDGKYSIRRVARIGVQNIYAITVRDVSGNTETKTISVTRQIIDSKQVLTKLNPLNVKIGHSQDAVAIIIGIEKYKRVAKADFANADAQDFYDYANRALGIKPENIKLLLDEGADDVEIYKAFQNWLPVKVKKGKTDVYVF